MDGAQESLASLVVRDRHVLVRRREVDLGKKAPELAGERAEQAPQDLGPARLGIRSKRRDERLVRERGRRVRPPSEDVETIFLGDSRELAHEARFADPRFAGDRDDTALAGCRRAYMLSQLRELQLALPTYEDEATPRT